MLDVLAWCKFVHLRIASRKSVILWRFQAAEASARGAQSARHARREESRSWWVSFDNHVLHHGHLFMHLFMCWSATAGNSGWSGDKTTTSGVEAESWIMNHSSKHVRIMNLCFKNLGIMNFRYFGSGIINNETLRRAQQNARIWINCVRSRECTMWRFRESNFQNFFPGEHRHRLRHRYREDGDGVIHLSR